MSEEDVVVRLIVARNRNLKKMTQYKLIVCPVMMVCIVYEFPMYNLFFYAMLHQRKRKAITIPFMLNILDLSLEITE